MEIQLWVRNAQGQVWGPLPTKQIELLVERKLIADVTESSRDGRTFSPVSQEPALSGALAKGATAARRQSGAAWSPSAGVVPAVPSRPEPAPPAPAVPSAPPAPQASVLTPASVAPASVLAPPRAPAPSPAPVSTAPPAPPQPAKIIQAAPPAGRLEEHSPFKLYYLLAAAEAGGKLVLGEGKSLVSVWFKAGIPHAVEAQSFGLGEYLVEQRVLKPEQLAGAQANIQQVGGDVASGLFAAGLLNPQTAFPLIQQHAQTVLQRGLLLESGPFTFDPAAAVPASGFQLGQRWQLLSSAARRMDPLRLRHWMQGREGMVAALAGSTTELQLTAQETRLLTNMDGKRSLSELVALAGPNADAMERLLILLNEIDRVVLTGSVAPAPADVAPEAPRTPTRPAVAPANPAPAPAAPPASSISGVIAQAVAANAAPKLASSGVPPPPMPAKPAPATAPPTARAAARPPAPAAANPAPKVAPRIAPEQGASSNMPALLKLLEELKTKDFYARLKVERTKGAIPMLKANFFQLAKLYHPDTVPPDGPEEARRVKADILSLLNEANGTLSDDAKRAEYFEELEARDAVGDLDVVAILAAEEDFQHAVALANVRKFAEALTIIEKCISTNAKEGEFYAWRGYCRFFGSQDKKTFRDVALADQKKALQLNPKCTVAWLFQGQIWKLLEDVPKAKAAFNKTLEMDPNNVEAQRELRLFEQRKK